MSLADAESPPVIGLTPSGYALLIAFPLVYGFSGKVPGSSAAVLLPLAASGQPPLEQRDARVGVRW